MELGDIMFTVFQVCFFVGIGLIVLSFVLGNLLDAFGIDGLDLDFDLLGLELFIPLSPMLFILFLTVFGGIGWILMKNTPFLAVILILIIAAGAGILISILVNLLVIKPLKKAQNTSAPSEEELVGLRAVVTETIIKDGFGEIRYVVNGNSYTAPAKATKNSEIKAGADVAICWVENHIFYVVSMEDE